MSNKMNRKNENHLRALKLHFVSMIDEKYRLGQKEHGGNLLDMDLEELLKNALMENIDQFTYLQSALVKLRKEKTRQIKVKFTPKPYIPVLVKERKNKAK